jgi:hypothetical protein
VSKDGLGRNGWIVICSVGIWAAWAAIEFKFRSEKPSLSGDAIFLLFLLFLWVRGRLQEQEERLKEMESRVEELEDQIRN